MLASLLTYSAALFVAVAAPGPAMLTVITRGLERGLRSGIAVGVGVAAGDVLLGSLALLGLAAILAMVSWLFVVIKFTGAAYLIWLGIRMWCSSAREERSDVASGGGNFKLGASTALANPKAVLFHASLMPLFIDVHHLEALLGASVLAIILLINILVMSTYALCAARGSAFFRTPQRMTLLHRLGGGSMVAAGAIAASR